MNTTIRRRSRATRRPGYNILPRTGLIALELAGLTVITQHAVDWRTRALCRITARHQHRTCRRNIKISVRDRRAQTQTSRCSKDKIRIGSKAAAAIELDATRRRRCRQAHRTQRNGFPLIIGAVKTDDIATIRRCRTDIIQPTQTQATRRWLTRHRRNDFIGKFKRGLTGIHPDKFSCFTCIRSRCICQRQEGRADITGQNIGPRAGLIAFELTGLAVVTEHTIHSNTRPLRCITGIQHKRTRTGKADQTLRIDLHPDDWRGTTGRVRTETQSAYTIITTITVISAYARRCRIRYTAITEEDTVLGPERIRITNSKPCTVELTAIAGCLGIGIDQRST